MQGDKSSSGIVQGDTAKRRKLIGLLLVHVDEVDEPCAHALGMAWGSSFQGVELDVANIPSYGRWAKAMGTNAAKNSVTEEIRRTVLDQGES